GRDSLSVRGLLDAGGDGGDADQQSGLDGRGVERLVQQVSGVRRDVHRGAGEDRVVALQLQRLQRSAVQAEQVGLGGRDLAVDEDVTVELRAARVHRE